MHQYLIIAGFVGLLAGCEQTRSDPNKIDSPFTAHMTKINKCEWTVESFYFHELFDSFVVVAKSPEMRSILETPTVTADLRGLNRPQSPTPPSRANSRPSP
jgi:hypothetical protein